MTKIYTLETKLAAVNDYLEGGDSIREIAKKYSVSKTMLHRWVTKFQNHGKEALQVQETYTNYSFEFKMDVLNYMNEMGASIDEATAVFNISSSGIVCKGHRDRSIGPPLDNYANYNLYPVKVYQQKIKSIPLSTGNGRDIGTGPLDQIGVTISIGKVL